MSFLCNDVSANPYETLCMSILSYALFSTQNSPFYKNLLESGLGTDYIPGNGYDYTTKESAFTIGVTGMKQHT